jgi:hypothetical protein
MCGSIWQCVAVRAFTKGGMLARWVRLTLQALVSHSPHSSEGAVLYSALLKMCSKEDVAELAEANLFL